MGAVLIGGAAGLGLNLRPLFVRESVMLSVKFLMRIDRDLRDGLNAVLARHRKADLLSKSSRSSLIRQAIREYVARELGETVARSRKD